MKQLIIKIDLKVFIVGILLVSIMGMIGANVLINNNDNIKDWFGTRNISSTDINNKTLDDVYNEGGTPITLILDLGDGEKAYSGIRFDEYEIKPLMEDLYDVYSCNTYKDFFNETSNQTEQYFYATRNRACQNLSKDSVTCNLKEESWNCTGTWQDLEEDLGDEEL